ncbi:Fur family ferric uptake transcriptional regulator [Lachnotalea glycerini]|uniref:Fur family ferric uptake transcriptional regulator n=1 Tax=Lachnotalea glycerini TaxID=1763509 RepID=A0A255SL38_9FIRM|nr:transcriptional repressor [Lachnotalea glycerini]OYP53630.1 Fur family transcriptional regulator [Lachnotalea glycerini]PXV89178.1 Fur family ferric uptake transcriptional regulator [Lachnotalea glycerini]RDY31474.1 Fur family transcriptional regulator [Lachnotalea glycerini]
MTRETNSNNLKFGHNTNRYLRTQLQKDNIIEQLKKNGCRITKQRLLLLDVILEDECSCCKEIYYKASGIDKSIGTATVYRMINKLEEIGAINRKNMYKVACSDRCEIENACTIELDDNTIYHFSAKNWNMVIKEGLKVCGYLKAQNILNVTVRQCECDGENCR